MNLEWMLHVYTTSMWRKEDGYPGRLGNYNKHWKIIQGIRLDQGIKEA